MTGVPPTPVTPAPVSPAPRSFADPPPDLTAALRAPAEVRRRRRLPAPLRVLLAPFLPSTWAAQIHLTLDLFVGIVVFTAVIVALSVLAGLACFVVTIPAIGWLTFIMMRVIGIFERARYRAVLDVRIADPYPEFTGTFWERVRARLLCGAAWKELVYGLVSLPLAVIGFVLSYAFWCSAFALVLLPAYHGVLPDGTAHLGFVDVRPGAPMWIAAGIGVVVLYLAPWVSRGWAALEVFMASNLLGRGVTAELEARVDVLEATRAWALEVAEAERRRIERDLHDGAQQRLVALAMELGMAKEKLDSDPERARELVEAAHVDAKAAIAELRDLARGIHPPDLGDQGLPGAIPVLARRCPVPVEVEVDVPVRPPASIEGIAYFVVSECLANISKHAEADQAGVRVTQSAGWLVIEVGDDGIGGAELGLGSGLRGLSDRVASVDGRFVVSSPIGGPTVIRVELPCAS